MGTPKKMFIFFKYDCLIGLTKFSFKKLDARGVWHFQDNPPALPAQDTGAGDHGAHFS